MGGVRRRRENDLKLDGTAVTSRVAEECLEQLACAAHLRISVQMAAHDLVGATWIGHAYLATRVRADELSHHLARRIRFANREFDRPAQESKFLAQGKMCTLRPIIVAVVTIFLGIDLSIAADELAQHMLAVQTYASGVSRNGVADDGIADTVCIAKDRARVASDRHAPEPLTVKETAMVVFPSQQPAVKIPNSTMERFIQVDHVVEQPEGRMPFDGVASACK